MPYARNGGISIYYDRQGQADGPTVVFIEGLGYGSWMWQWQRDPLSDAYDTIVLDNRGTGKSEGPDGPYTIHEMAADLESVLAHAGVRHAYLVGASMGGMIAQQYALEYERAKAAALLCTSHGGEEAIPPPAETQERIFDVPESLSEREAVRYKMAPAMSDGFMEANPELIADIVNWRLEEDAAETARNAQAAAVEEFDVSHQVGKIDVPVLVMHGTADQVLPVENGRLLHEKLPDSRLELFEGGSHLFFIENSDSVTRRLRRFLDDCT